MARINDRSVGKGEEASLYRAQQGMAVATGQIRSADAEAEECVPTEEDGLLRAV